MECRKQYRKSAWTQGSSYGDVWICMVCDVLPSRCGGALVEGLIKERDPHAFEDAEHEFLAITTHRYVCCCPCAFLLNWYIFIPLHVVSNPFLLPSLAYIPLIGNDSREIPNPSSCG